MNNLNQDKIVIFTRQEIKDIIAKLATYKEVIDKGYKLTPNQKKRELLAIESFEIKKLIEKLKKED